MDGDDIVEHCRAGDLLGDIVSAIAHMDQGGYGPINSEMGCGIAISVIPPFIAHNVELYRVYRLVMFGPKRKIGILAEYQATIAGSGDKPGPFPGLTEGRRFFSGISLGLSSGVSLEMGAERFMSIAHIARDAIAQASQRLGID
ncbi:hypothetical protein HGA91_03355 [candidate division WWE3 bacterium]|nr:hypothetical protein [candidate division WWE3 bacterium]